MNNEVTVVYFTTVYSHLEGQAEEWLCVSPFGNPTGIRGDYPLNLSGARYNWITWALAVDITVACID
jgi:hypothetical protein